MRKTMLGAVLAFAPFVTAIAQTPQIQINKDNRTITITTSAGVKAEAEVAKLHIGFVTYAQDEQSAYAAGSQRSNAIFSALLSAGVAKKDIESETQGVNPVQPFETANFTADEKNKRKFQVAQSWSVECAADDAAKLLDAAVKAGANSSGGIDWNVRDEDALQAQAAAKALTSARSVATAMAGGLGVKLGALVYASNEAPESPRPVFRAMAAAKQVTPTPSPLAIATRRVEKFATVTAVFAIE